MIRRTRRSTRKDTLLPYTTLFRSESRKGTELHANPHAALLFHWKSLRRQVRIEGPVGPVDDATADAYFATRSRDSQLGAWASDQSRPLESRDLFMARYDEEIGRASWRVRVCEYGEISGGAGSIKKKKQ